MLEQIRRFIVALAIAGWMPACGPIKPPGPPTPPPPEEPATPSPVCEPPGLVTGCWHQPPGEPWQFIPPTTLPQPSGDCSPTLDSKLGAPANDDANWRLAADQSTSNGFKQAVWQAVDQAKAACPAAWAGDCMKAGVSGIDHGYLLIAKELQKSGWSVSQAKDSDGKVYDHLYVRRAPGTFDWNATKLFYYGNGCLITGDGAFTVHGWYTFVGSDPTPPPVEPPPVSPPAGACSDPLPPKVWTEGTLPPGWGQDQIGKPRWVIEGGPHGVVIDNTAKVAPQACDYCASIGMGESGGQLRCGCPVRNECPGTFKCEERAACEAYLTGGTKLQTCAEAKAADPEVQCTPSSATCEFVNNNPFQFRPSGGNCRLCSVEDPRVCGGWF